MTILLGLQIRAVVQLDEALALLLSFVVRLVVRLVVRVLGGFVADGTVVAHRCIIELSLSITLIRKYLFIT